MKFSLVNIVIDKSSISEILFDDKILKEIAFGAKYKTQNISYTNVMIPIVPIKTTLDYFGLVYILNIL